MIGIDVGGANLKCVGDGGVSVHYCPLWKGSPIKGILSGHRWDDERAAVVMSGELADCFSSKDEGIEFIVRAVLSQFPGARFYGTDGRFHSGPAPCLAAANWLAAADWLRDSHPSAVLVDMGSTTTDIIPVPAFPSLLGLTDLSRLQRGYLLYTGMLRTNIATTLQEVRVNGTETRTSSEYFAQSADAHLLLGHIDPAGYTCETPDKGEKSIAGAERRIARVVCADPEEIGGAGIMDIAKAFWTAQQGLIAGEVRRIAAQYGASEVLTAGIGSELLAEVLGGKDLAEEIGEAADALPAFAVREVALRDQPFPP
ncbi:MAG: H4MPT-linked C1 transfer pathway protein [Methanoregulaceae archaeon]|nr:H4MPT-linked C1 transfer pathway protein [Methanoregulaceae archaeon]